MVEREREREKRRLDRTGSITPHVAASVMRCHIERVKRKVSAFKYGRKEKVEHKSQSHITSYYAYVYQIRTLQLKNFQCYYYEKKENDLIEYE